MNVLMVGLDDSVVDAGSDTRNRHEAYTQILREKEPGSTVRVLCHGPGRTARVNPVDGLLIHPIDTRRALFPLGVVRTARKVGVDPDLVVTQTPLDDGFAGSLVARGSGTPWLAQHHSPFFDDPEWRSNQLLSPLKRSLFQVTRRQFDAVRVVSRAAIDWYRGKNVPRSKIYHNPVSVRMASPDPTVDLPEGVNALYVGRLVTRKGLSTLIRAFGAATNRVELNDPTLHVVGPGSDETRRRLRSLADEEGIADLVEIHGFLPDSMVSAYYRGADVTISPSLLEPYGRVAVESLLSGTPVIATDTVGARDIVSDGRWGYLVPKRNVSVMSDRIVKLLSNPNRAAIMGEHGKQYATSEHDPDTLREDWIDIWRAVASDHTSIRDPREPPFTPPEGFRSIRGH